MVITPARENVVWSLVFSIVLLDEPLRLPFSKYLSLRLCRFNTRVLFEGILFTVNVVGRASNTLPSLRVISFDVDAEDWNVWGNNVSSAKLMERSIEADTLVSFGIMPLVWTKISSSFPLPLAIANVLLLLSITTKTEMPIIIEIGTKVKLLRTFAV